MTWQSVVSTDNSGNVSLTGSHEPGRDLNIGSIVVYYEAQDPSGNMAFCNFTVTVTGNF